MTLLFTLAAGLAGQSPSSDTSFGVWPWLVGNIDSSVPAIVQQAQLSGQDTIYLHLWRTSGVAAGTLHMQDESGTWNPALGSIAPDVTLTSFLAQAHAAGLQVVGVVNCFLAGAPLPGDPVHEAHLLSVIDYLVHSYTGTGDPWYDLDGIALDRVRFDSGTSNPHQVVTSFVSRVKQAIGLLPLHAYLIASLWHIDGPPYDGSFRSYNQAMGLLQGQFGQHWEDLSAYVDVNLPMAYIADGGLYGSNYGLMQAYLGTVASYADQAALIGGNPQQRVVPAIRFWNDSTGTTTAASVSACCVGALLGGADGVMAFRYFTATASPSWWAALSTWSAPGADLPLASLSSTVTAGLSAQVSATANGASGGPYQYRFDLDGDGVPDGPWTATAAQTLLLPQAGHLRAAVLARDAAGRQATGRHQVSILTSTLGAGPGLVSVSSGGAMPLAVSFGPAAAGLTYVMAGSLSGTSPGVPVSPSVSVPLNPDFFTDLTLQYAGTPFLANTLGSLDALGSASATFWMPPGILPAGLAWNTISFASVGIAPASATLVVVSNPVSFTVLP